MTYTPENRPDADERRAALPGAIREFIETNGFPPTPPELGVKFGVSRATIDADLARLVAAGIVERPAGGDQRRALRLTGYKVRLIPPLTPRGARAVAAALTAAAAEAEQGGAE